MAYPTAGSALTPFISLVAGLALASAGAAASSAATSASTVCDAVPHDAVVALLFGDANGQLNSHWEEPDDAHGECRWEARPADSRDVRRMTLERTRYADAAQASAALARETGGDTAPSEAVTRDPADALARPGPFAVAARHDAVVALLDAAGAELNGEGAAREVRYRLDAAALAAAGAAVRPAPDFSPSADPGDGGWIPPPHSPGPADRLAEPLVAAVAWGAQAQFLLMPLMALSIFGTAFGSKLMPRALRPAAIALAAGVSIYVVANLIVGTQVADRLVYHGGVPASAVVTGHFATSTQYNNHDVVGYDVLFRAASGRLVKTSFEDDDFNVYPFHNSETYPEVGDRFTVRYLPQHPSRFIIVGDDGSPWARGLRCSALGGKVEEAARRHGYAPGDVDLARGLKTARRDASAAGC